MLVISKVTQLHEGGVRPLNEDSVLVNEEFRIFGVFDGASSLDSYTSSDGKTGAYIASHIAADTFAHSNQSLAESIKTADIAIEKAHTENSIDVSTSAQRFSTTVAVVKITDDRAELLQIGDSIIIVIYKDGHAEVPLGYHDHDLEVMQKWRKLADQGKTNIRQIVADDVIKLRESSNITYGTLNGDGAYKKFMENAVLDLSDVSTILIITDGMFIPKSDPETEEDWGYYGQLYKEGGLQKLYQKVRELEKTDPQLIKYPRYKLHDDASGVAIELS